LYYVWRIGTLLLDAYYYTTKFDKESKKALDIFRGLSTILKDLL